MYRYPNSCRLLRKEETRCPPQDGVRQPLSLGHHPFPLTQETYWSARRQIPSTKRIVQSAMHPPRHGTSYAPEKKLQKTQREIGVASVRFADNSQTTASQGEAKIHQTVCDSRRRVDFTEQTSGTGLLGHIVSGAVWMPKMACAGVGVRVRNGSKNVGNQTVCEAGGSKNTPKGLRFTATCLLT